MQYAELGSTGYSLSRIGFGAWAIGGTWGPVQDEDSYAALNRAIDLGVNFIDTADVYGDGRSEKLIGRLLKERSDERIYVATKAGRRLSPHIAEGYTYENLRSFVGLSLQNLGVESLDLLQLHCPPTETYDQASTFEALDRLQQEGMLRHYGVSVETVAEALRAIEYPNVQSVQIIFNAFRLKPAEDFFRQAQERNVGVIARVPLASGLLSGKMSADRRFDPEDHREFNRHGESFDKGETFSGVDFETGLQAAEELKRVLPSGVTLAQLALRFILMHDAVTTAIPGAKRVDQVQANTAAADLPPLTPEQLQQVQLVYDQYIRPQVHHLW